MTFNSIKRMVVAGAICAFAFMGIANAEQMRASIPFEFRIDGKVLPAGEYMVKMDVIQQRITLEQLNGTVQCYLFGGRASWPNNEGGGILTFNRYGDNYFLSSLRAPNGGVGYKLGKSKAEREMAKVRGGREVAVESTVKTPRS
jgi:hypothetical protein